MELAIIICLVIVIAIGIWFIIVSNSLNKALIKIDEADSGIDIALTKRYDVLIKMMDVVKAYTKHEKETLFEVVKLRKNMNISEKNEANNKMNNNFEQIKIIAENYPELRSSDNYIALQNAIVEVEEHLQAARRLYNSNVSTFNQKIVVFPSSIVANLKGLKEVAFFEADETKKEDVKINL